MPKVSDVFNCIDSFAPFDTQLGFDNAGLLVGSMSDSVSKIAIALDATKYTVNYAADNGCDLLVTHHPIIFTPLKNISVDDPAYISVKRSVDVISAHTNLDAAVGGVNDCFAKVIGIKEVFSLSDGEDIVPMARIGDFECESASKFASYLKLCLNCGCVKLTLPDKKISKVALCGGAGGDYLYPAFMAGADAFVTGECRHHERLLAARLGISLLECGHFSTERFIKSKLKESISDICDRIIIVPENDPAIYI